MKLQWLGEYRELVEATICFANKYSSVHNKEFMGDKVKFSFSEIQVVEYLLEKEEDKLKMAEVAKHLGISASMFTKQVNKLVKKGILQKYHRKDNKKDIVIQVTPLGKNVYQEYTDQIAKKTFGEMFEIGKELTKEELEIFTRMIRSLDSKINWKGKEPVILIPVEES